MTEVLNARKSGLSADSSDDDLPGHSHLNADSSEEETSRGKFNADSSDDEGVQLQKNELNADSSDEECTVDKLDGVKSNKSAKDSSDDEGPRINAKKKIQNNLDSSDEEEISTTNTSIRAAKPIIDSDESDENTAVIAKAQSSDEELTDKTSSIKKRKIKRTVESDSDSEGPASQNSTSTPSHKSQASHFNSSQNLLKNKDLYDAESSEDELPEVPYTPCTGSKDNEYSDEDEESLDAIKKKVVKKHKKSPKTERSSAKNAMMEIRSESARMTRESAIGLPYHRPKPRTLEEFLNRKKGTPDILKSMTLKKIDSHVDKILAEREQKMKEFYKSESEEEQDVEDKDKDYGPNEESKISLEVVDGVTSNAVADKVVKTGPLHVDEKSDELNNVDSGLLSGLGTSDESNQNTDEDKSMPNSPKIQESNINEEIVDTDITENNDSGMAVDTEEESLKLVLEPDTPSLECDDDEIIFNSQVPKDDKSTPTDKAWTKLKVLQSKFGDLSSLEKTLQMTPTISEGADDDLIISETEKPSLSTGAQNLFNRFFSHAKVCKEQPSGKDGKDISVENLTIVSKKIVDGKEVLEKDVIEYKFDAPKEKSLLNPGSAYLSLKQKLKREMMAKRNAAREKRAENIKINNEDGYDDLPDEEMGIDEQLEDEEEEYDDEEEYDEDEESDIEENEIEVKKSRVKNRFVEDEAEDDDELSDNGGEVYDDDNDSVDVPKKNQFKKIVDPDLLSESSNTSDIFNKLDRIRCDAETPTLNHSKLNLTSAPSSNSSFGALISAEPRWTPFQDRISAGTVELTSADNTNQESPTNSQLAKKKLGFEGLFDQTDPDVSDIDDVVGLCSGKFLTQEAGMSEAALMASGKFVTQHKLQHEISGLAALESTKIENIETQDTLILTSDSRPSSRTSHNVETQDTVILTGNLEQNVSNAISCLDKMLGFEENEESLVIQENKEPEGVHGAIESDDNNEGGGIKISKKRKRRVVSDSDDSDNESGGTKMNVEKEVKTIEYDSDENEIKKPKFTQKLFNKKGKLRKDFFEAEAELSGGSDDELQVSDDEDERGLDKFEMEEGDLDEIDENVESEKVGRIHQKVLLDEDQANLKLFQERFLEDGDLHTDYKRQKQFKWAGLDDNIEVGPRKEDEEGELEEETLEKWRMEKMKREKWLQDHEMKKGVCVDQDEEDSQFFQLADKTLQRMSSKDDTLNSSEVLEKEKLFKSPPAKFGPLQPLQNLGGGMRGSFLARGEASLDKIAQFNKIKDDKVGTGAKGRNFVFAAISPSKIVGDGGDSPGDKKGKVKPPPAKKVKRCRTLDENSKGTIFNLL